MHTHTWYALLLTVLCNGPVSVRLSHHSTAAVACGGFAVLLLSAVRVGDIDRQQWAPQHGAQ